MRSPSSCTKRRGSGSALCVSCSPPEDSRVWRLSVFILDRTHPSNPRRNRMTVNRASARYEGFGKEGKGSITTKSGVLDKQPSGFGTRFASQPGTNPEELIAAAHAASFTMPLQSGRPRAGSNRDPPAHHPTLSLQNQEGGFPDPQSPLKH